MCTCKPEFKGDAVIGWIKLYFNDCIYTWTDIASFAFGWCSIVIWCICLFPQIWMNYKAKRVDGISFWFILEWVLGDVTNLVGCILTQNLPTQTYQAFWFVTVDIALLAQWFYYKARTRRIETTFAEGYCGSLTSDYTNFERQHAGSIISPVRRVPSPGLSRIGSRNSLNHQLLAIVTLCCLTCKVNAYQTSPGCLDEKTLSPLLETVGIVLAWTSGLMYFSSRCPQIIQNWQLQSTEGLSFGMFCLTISGNMLYGLSILLRRPAINSAFNKKKLPYLIGSVGTFVFDIAIIVQFFMYRNASLRFESEDTHDPSWYTPKDSQRT